MLQIASAMYLINLNMLNTVCSKPHLVANYQCNNFFKAITCSVLHGVVQKADFALPLEDVSVFKFCFDLAQMLFCLEPPDYLFY